MEDYNKLVEIRVEDWPKLRDLYVNRKSESVSYNMIQNYISWLNKDPSIDFVKFFSLNGDWSDGTFVLQDSYLVLFDTLSDVSNANRLLELLFMLNYSELRVLNGYNSRLQPIVEKVVTKIGLNGYDKLNGSYDLYVLRQPTALTISFRKPPEGIKIRPLVECNTRTIDEIWDFRHPGSLGATTKLIKYGRSLGAFTEDGQLVAWIIVQQTGALGLLKVRDDFRRLGIASILVSTITKDIAATGLNDTFVIAANTQNKLQDRLLAALDCLDKKPARNLSGFPERLRGTFEKYCLQQNIEVNSENLCPTLWFHISPQEALQFDICPPEGVTLSSLRLADIDTINSLWPHRHEGSEKFIERLITFNPSIGAYDKDGNIISWCLQLPIGALGVLHVKEEHKRKGFGSLMVRVLSKMLAEKGIEITAPVVETNVASKNMFEKLGFQKIDKVYWLSKPASN